ncbi:MAG: hypothetical protein IPG04_08340 [Polyangiaceae bacterium]|nr:hypothetical protein [Polyangiaceae bacterium]
MFVNFGDNSRLDKMGFAAVCQVTGNGMDVVDKLYAGYDGRVSDQQFRSIESEGNTFLRSQYKHLDYVKTTRLTTAGADPSKG